MAETRTIDVSDLIDHRRINAFNAVIVLLCFFAVFADGYDSSVMGFVGPYLVKAWGITNMAALGPVFSASLPGLVVGSLLFGYVGDRYGRRLAIVGSSLVVGIFTLSSIAAGSIEQLVAMRFLAGIGIGGLIPNAIAINAEYAPTRYRSTLIIVMYTGVNFGSSAIGVVANTLVPSYGWQAFFYVGGTLPLLAAIFSFFWLPESIKYLAARGRDQAQLARLVRRMAPALSVGPETRFVTSEERASKNLSPKRLFVGSLRWLTPLLWTLFICNQMAFFFVASWLPTILARAHFPAGDAAWTLSLFGIGGIVGGYAMCRPLDRFGMAPIAFLFAASLPIVGAIGYSTGSEAAVMGLTFLSGVCIYGSLYGINASSAVLYPTAIRSNASGWAHAVAKIGSVASTNIAGFLLFWKVPAEHIFLLLLIPLGIATAASYVMARLTTSELPGIAAVRVAG